MEVPITTIIRVTIGIDLSLVSLSHIWLCQTSESQSKSYLRSLAAWITPCRVPNWESRPSVNNWRNEDEDGDDNEDDNLWAKYNESWNMRAIMESISLYISVTNHAEEEKRPEIWKRELVDSLWKVFLFFVLRCLSVWKFHESVTGVTLCRKWSAIKTCEENECKTSPTGWLLKLFLKETIFIITPIYSV